VQGDRASSLDKAAGQIRNVRDRCPARSYRKPEAFHTSSSRLVTTGRTPGRTSPQATSTTCRGATVPLTATSSAQAGQDRGSSFNKQEILASVVFDPKWLLEIVHTTSRSWSRRGQDHQGGAAFPAVPRGGADRAAAAYRQDPSADGRRTGAGSSGTPRAPGKSLTMSSWSQAALDRRSEERQSRHGHRPHAAPGTASVRLWSYRRDCGRRQERLPGAAILGKHDPAWSS